MKKNTQRIIKLSEERKNKSKIIASMNNKGGCGKTTLLYALGIHLARYGNNVLFVDMDAQSNLTRRLGVYGNERIPMINSIFRDYETLDIKTLPRIKDYKKAMRAKNSSLPFGIIALISGNRRVTLDAENCEEAMRFDAINVSDFFKEKVDFFKDYFDYILLDTAPALESNLLNILAIKTADEIIYPIDSLHAADGLSAILPWTVSTISGLSKKPNGLFAMVRYQESPRRQGVSYEEGIHNVVYNSLKVIFGDFMCTNGVRERKNYRDDLSPFEKTEYTPLCEEIINKITLSSRPNLFELVSRRSLIEDLDKLVHQLEQSLSPKESTLIEPIFV